jgi:formylglycine-generating enzyme required for sulfatase activity
VRDHFLRIAQVTYARHLGFVDLVRLAELNLATAFRGAILRGDLRGQDLSGFDFTGGEFNGCDLTGADLSRAEGVTPEMLVHAITDETTIWPRTFFWASGRAPSWADDWGHDEYGPWVTFRVPNTDVTQRMRWCPPGSFMMGSPDDEWGRVEDESPHHRVTLVRGFWVFDTACTEKLWTAVMGMPPSGIRSAGIFPVTHVNWSEVQAFAQALNVLLPGLSVGLPSEACWEYACRAGTETPTGFGETVTLEQVRFHEYGLVPVGSLPANP